MKEKKILQNQKIEICIAFHQIVEEISIFSFHFSFMIIIFSLIYWILNSISLDVVGYDVARIFYCFSYMSKFGLITLPKEKKV